MAGKVQIQKKGTFLMFSERYKAQEVCLCSTSSKAESEREHKGEHGVVLRCCKWGDPLLFSLSQTVPALDTKS